MSLVPSPLVAAVEAFHPSVKTLAAAFLLAHEGATREAYGRDLQSWFQWCRDHDIDRLAAQRAHVDAYARTLAEVPDAKGKTRSPATVARHLCTLSGFFKYAVGEDAVARNPVANVKRPKVGTDTVSTGLDKKELAALIRVAEADSPRSLALVLLLGLNGLRISEALGAGVEDLGTERGHRVLKIKRRVGRRRRSHLLPGRPMRWTDTSASARTTRCLSRAQVSAGTGPRRGARCDGSHGPRFLRRPTHSIPTTYGTPS